MANDLITSEPPLELRVGDFIRVRTSLGTRYFWVVTFVFYGPVVTSGISTYVLDEEYQTPRKTTVVQPHCAHCDEPHETHVNDRCLFDTTVYQPVAPPPEVRPDPHPFTSSDDGW